MYVVTIIPVARGIFKEELSYFSTFPVTVGDMATVQARNQEIKGLVVAVRSARDLKSELKQTRFSLKKILRTESSSISPALLAVAIYGGAYFAANISQVLGSMFPKRILPHLQLLSPHTRRQSVSGQKNALSFCFEGAASDRLAYIHDVLAKEYGKILYIAPSVYELHHAAQYFSDAGKSVSKIHGGITAKKLAAVIENAARSDIVCTTPEYGFAFLPFISCIILDHESSVGYRDQSKLGIDYRILYARFGEETSVPLFRTDTVLETIRFISADSVQSLSRWPEITIAKKERIHGESSWLLGKNMRARIRETLKEKARIFIFAPRKGIATVTLCGDCNTPHICTTCSKPLTLEERRGERFFWCSRCRNKSQTDISCLRCGSWNTKPLGVTTESVAEEVRMIFPEAHVAVLSSSHATTAKQAERIVKRFYTTEGSVLIGTEMAFYYLKKKILYTGIASIDPFFISSALDSTDKQLRIIYETAFLSNIPPLIETAIPDHPVFESVKKGGPDAARKTEGAERKSFLYPPFGTLILVTRTAKESVLKNSMSDVVRLLASWKPKQLPHKRLPKEMMRGAILIHLEHTRWPDKHLTEMLRALRPSYDIRINPESVV